jgi:hypothetical protein
MNGGEEDPTSLMEWSSRYCSFGWASIWARMKTRYL